MIVGISAFGVALLTFFSGFGLGSLLLPAFAVFFPLDLAVAATAVVHLSNNLFKLALMGRYANLRLALAFGLPAAVAAFAGAWALMGMSRAEPITGFQFLGHECVIEPMGLAIGGLIIGFALFDLLPQAKKLEFPAKAMPLGGVLSGFFGGLSGHQGALRSAFLIKAGLDRNAFVGTNVVCAVMVDVVRLTVYGTAYLGGEFLSTKLSGPHEPGPLILTAIGCAFVGTFGASKIIHKVTLGFVQNLVGALLLVLGTAIAIGLL